MKNDLELGYQIELTNDMIFLRRDGEVFKAIQVNPNNAIEKYAEWNTKLKEYVIKQKVNNIKF
jgi:hypothetical protein